jgi:predicted RNase H-like HicB family nuclease
MQYQVFVQNQPGRKFLASVVGMSNLTAEGITEEEAISNVKSVLESQLSAGKFVNTDVNVATILILGK